MRLATEKRLKKVRERLMAAVLEELRQGDITSDELLAILAHTTGACIAWQDQRKMTAEQAMDLVARNIEGGNAEALSELAQGQAGNA